MATNRVLVQVNRLTKYFNLHEGFWGRRKSKLKAIDDVTFSIYSGETLGLVGESGCGKTTLGRTVLRLYRPTAGQIVFDGQDITELPDHELFPLRRRMQMIFQDPYASLDARMTVGDIIGEPLDIHKLARGLQRQEMITELLIKVGLRPEHINRYPHEFSGGQRQRVGIARALALHPDFIVCDEPLSALDVSIQAQVVNLLQDLQQELGLTYLFIAHDLSMVKHISNRIGVMYLGKLVELAPSADLYKNPLHPYTKALLSAIPIPDPDWTETNKRILLEGHVPSPINPPLGCRFQTRCNQALPVCAVDDPPAIETIPGRYVACHLIN